MKHEKCTVEDFLTSRHVRETIHSFVERSVGIDVATETYTYRFEIVDEKFAWEVLSAVERHVFEEVSETILVVFFEDSTYGLSDVEFAAFFRLVVVTNVISKAIVEHTHTYVLVDREKLWLLCLEVDAQCTAYDAECEKKYFFQCFLGFIDCFYLVELVKLATFV